MAAERGVHPASLMMEPAASMGPRLNGRGARGHLVRAVRRREASMGLRLNGRGAADGLETEDAAKSGFNGAAAEWPRSV